MLKMSHRGEGGGEWEDLKTSNLLVSATFWSVLHFLKHQKFTNEY